MYPYYKLKKKKNLKEVKKKSSLGPSIFNLYF